MRLLQRITIVCSLVTLCSLTSSNGGDPCPLGCRCTAGHKMHARHRWHRLLAAYRTHRMVYGGRGNASPVGNYKDLSSPQGRQMTCVGLQEMPENVPRDVSKLTLFGDTRGNTVEQQDSPAGGSSSEHGHHGFRYNQLTAINKYAFRDTTEIKELVVEGNRIKVMHPNDLDMLTSLKKLRLKSNRMKVIWGGALGGLRTLEELDLSENHLKRLPREVFQDTPHLKRLLLNANRLRGLNKKTFSSVENLEYLDLSDNYLRDLPKDIFYGTPNLKEIILDKNHLMMIRPEWFATATQVTRLSLGENRIKDLSSSIFQPLRNLKVLTLEKNEIRQLRAGSFPGTSSLHTLTLAENNITHVDNYVFRDMLSLRELDFRGNHVKMLTNSTFAGLNNLEGLNLANNDLLDIRADNFHMLKLLTRLDLSHNFIKTVKTRNFYGLLDLRELRLDHNDIRVIEDEGFAVSMVNTYSKLTWLYLHFNKLGAITEDNLYGLSYVKFLNLCHNELSYIEPGGLAMMRRLHTLVLNNNHLMDLTPGTFKQVRHLQHLNLAANQIRQLTLNTLQGLDRLEDLNLEDNKLTELPVSVLVDTPRLTSLDLTRNKLRNVDLSLLEAIPRLKYLDLSRNSITKVRTTPSIDGKLFYLSLADNNLRTMTEDIMNCMSTGSAVHLYGNPWSCDCNLAWLHGRKRDRTVKLPDQEEIVCKSPPNVAGEQVMSLHEEDFRCSYNNDYRRQSDDPRIQYDDTTSITCDFLDHAADEISRSHAKSRKDDLLQWIITMYGTNNQVFCKGVLISRGWIMTSSQCWKRGSGSNLTLVQGENQERRVSVVVNRIYHYPGSLDLALVSLLTERDTVFPQQRVFPCLLSETGWSHSQSVSRNGILETTRHNKKSGVKVRGVPVKLITSPQCAGGGVCYVGNPRYKKTLSNVTNAPLFVKVGRTKWALAGLSGTPRGANQGPIRPLYPAAAWIEHTMDA